MSSPTLSRVTTIGLKKRPSRPTLRPSCGNPSCPGSCGRPNIGNSPIQIGDVVSVCMSVYAPFKWLLGIRLTDSESFYTSKGARPTVVTDVPKNSNMYKIAIMASFCKSEEDKVPAAFKDFLIPIPTSRWPVGGDTEHVHTTPEWERAPQYLIVIPVPCHKDKLRERWYSHRVDGASQKRFAFSLSRIAFAKLEEIIERRLGHWNDKGQYEMTREEYLRRLEKVKEDRAKTLRDSTNSALSHTPSCKSACKRTIGSELTSLAEVPEEAADSEGFRMVCGKRVKRHRENHPATPSTKSRR